ncbi:MAG: hypothetical protein M8357_00090 [Desulfobulbaceae bacterium]|nr:hypothetical protein [Desulfobulbaceae bacterium]
MTGKITNSRHLYRQILSILAVITPLFFSPHPAAGEESCTQLLTTRCETCHYLTRVCEKVEREQEKKYWFGGPEGSWRRSIKNMVGQGAKLNKAEEEILVECLSKPHPDVLSLCKLDK